MIARFFFLIFVGLFAVVTPRPVEARSCEAHLGANNVAKLLSGPMRDPVQYKFAIDFLHHLEAIDNSYLEKNLPWLWSDDAALDSLENEWKSIFKGENNETLQLSLHRDKSRNDDHLVVLGTLFDPSGDAIGFFGRTFYWNHAKQAEAWGNGMYFVTDRPRSKGISRYVHLFLDSLIYPKLGVTREGLEADYIGRYLWAKKGYTFDETMMFTEVRSGQTFNVRAICQRNFVRFVERFGFKIGDLVFDRGQHGQVPLIPESHLLQPGDYLSVKHRDGRKIRMGALLGYRTLGEPEDYDIGHAFLNSDYHRYDNSNPGIKTVLYPSQISDDAMPFWLGFVDVTQRSLSPIE